MTPSRVARIGIGLSVTGMLITVLTVTVRFITNHQWIPPAIVIALIVILCTVEEIDNLKHARRKHNKPTPGGTQTDEPTQQDYQLG